MHISNRFDATSASGLPVTLRRAALFFLCLLLGCISRPGQPSAKRYSADVIVYGGTSAAVMAAVQVKRMGKSVIGVSPDIHLGGLSSGGLGFTDSGDKEVIGGLAREFYRRLYDHYRKDEAWKWQKRSEYGNKGQQTVALDGESGTMWIFEPHVAEKVFEDFLRENAITVHRDTWLDRSSSGMATEHGKIISFRSLNGNTYRGKMFIDATYEGDLMAAAGIRYRVGREANSEYGERWNGVQTGVFHHQHHFAQKVDPYKIKGEPSSGLLPEISAEPPGAYGSADGRLQAYCFRLCMSNHPDNRVPFPKPEGYDPSRYELLRRLFDAGWRDVFAKFDAIPNRKTDTNNHGPFSSDYIGKNYDYPEAGYERRAQIVDEHRNYQQGLLYFLSNDPDVPEEIRARMAQWGLAKDEFTDNHNWPHQLYVREARRMVGDFIMTEKDALGKTDILRPIGMGSYALDSHNAQRYVTSEGFVQNEGDIGVKPDRPYSIDYGAILPKESECANMLVPVCVSSSHIAYGSIRMEPVFMILGQSAATAAVLAIGEGTSPQKLPYQKLRQALLRDRQRLE
ncbi:MAG TPA: FAD-dependent oxidoreductase [Chryseosolibacter sp.]